MVFNYIKWVTLANHNKRRCRYHRNHLTIRSRRWRSFAFEFLTAHVTIPSAGLYCQAAFRPSYKGDNDSFRFKGSRLPGLNYVETSPPLPKMVSQTVIASFQLISQARKFFLKYSWTYQPQTVWTVATVFLRLGKIAGRNETLGMVTWAIKLLKWQWCFLFLKCEQFSDFG